MISQRMITLGLAALASTVVGAMKDSSSHDSDAERFIRSMYDQDVSDGDETKEPIPGSAFNDLLFPGEIDQDRIIQHDATEMGWRNREFNKTIGPNPRGRAQSMPLLGQESRSPQFQKLVNAEFTDESDVDFSSLEHEGGDGTVSAKIYSKIADADIKKDDIKKDDIKKADGAQKKKGFVRRFITSTTVWGLAFAGTAGVFAGLDLAAINPEHLGDNVFTGHNIEIGDASDGGFVGACAIIACVSIGLTLLACSLANQQKNRCLYHWMWVFTLIGSGTFMTGLNFIQTNAPDLGTSITNGFTGVPYDVPVPEPVPGMEDVHNVELPDHNHVELAQVLLIVGSAILFIAIILFVFSIAKKCKN